MRKVIFRICVLFSFSIFGQEIIENESSINNYYTKGLEIMYHDKDSANFYFDNSLTVAYKLNKVEYILDILNAKIRTAEHYFDLKSYKKHLNHLDELIKDTKFLQSDSPIDIAHYRNKILIDKGAYYYSLCNYSKSKVFFKELLTKLEALHPSSFDTYQMNHYITCLSYLGAINQYIGKIKLAENYYRKQIQIVKKNKNLLENWENYLYNTKSHLAKVYHSEKLTEQGKNEMADVITFYKSQNSLYYLKRLVNCTLLMSELYLEQDSLNLALQSLKSIEKHLNPQNHFHIRKQNLLAEWYLKKELYDSSLSKYNFVLHKTIKYRNDSKHQDVAEIYIKLGDLEKSRKRNNASLQYYQKALISAAKNFDSNNILNNPTPKNVFSKTQALTIFKKKLEVLNLILVDTDNKEILRASTNTSKSIITTLDALRPEFENKLDKQFLIKQTYPAFHEMLQSAYKGFKATADLNYLENAFLYLEKSKGILLLESVKNTQAISFSNIPDSIIEKEHQYKAYITNAEKKLINADEKSKLFFNDSLFKLNTNYYDFLGDLESNYPKYYQLKYDTRTTTIKELQEFIHPNETLLSFHQTDKDLFIFITTKKVVKLLKKPFTTTLKNDINHFHKLLSYPTRSNSLEIKKLAISIYEEILAPCIANDKNTNLTIIADGILNYLPFGALIDSKTGEYLIKYKNFRYANSATLLARNSNPKDNKENNLLVFSPIFDSDSGYSSLPFSKQEANIISGYFKGKTLFAENASLDNFIALKDDYSLCHFATHASANDQEPDFSYLTFSSKKESSNFLYVKDLYNYKLNFDMVTLSACESGIGKLQNGEGMLSLARGFQYAGVKSLTTSLWKNDDEATSQLMGYYYKNLKKGVTKSIALQKAKLEYLNKTEEEELKHPYYWSSFVVLGENTPISNKPVPFWLQIGFCLLGFGLLVFGYKKSKGIK